MIKKIRVLIVDDHPLLRQALRRVFHGHTDIEVVGEGCDGTDAIEKVSSLRPDVVIMDLGLPNKSGLQAIQDIVMQRPEVRILVFSGSEDIESTRTAIEAGALGFIRKSDPDVDIIKAVRDTFDGMTTLKGDILRKVFKEPRNQIKKPEYEDHLSKRELDITNRIARGETNQQIASELYLSESTVRSHINHILNKLDLNSRVDLVRLVLTNEIKKNE